MTSKTGPLAGIKVLELAGLGPAPFGCMVLADLGADVLKIQRPGTKRESWDILDRGRRVLEVDLKSPDGKALVRQLASMADVLVEAFRPGVAERLGVGPDECLAENPRLIYARMTGWGQDGPRAPRAGHDINYASIAGALGAIGEPGRKPVPPLNLVADFGGGAMFLVTGVLAALVERSNSGEGQVVDVAMVDGTATLLSMALSHLAAGIWKPERGVNLLDGGAPFYDTYVCSDGGYISVGALEPQFFAQLITILEVTDQVGEQYDTTTWPVMRELFTQTIKAKSRDEWTRLFDGTDACVAPVLRLDELANDPQLNARGTLIDRDGVVQPASAPRFSRTPGQAGDAADDQLLTADDAINAWS